MSCAPAGRLPAIGCVGRGGAGITLLEVILAVALTVGIVGSALGFYSYALQVREGLEQRAREIEAGRLVMDLMTRELRSATTYEFLSIGVEGQVDQMRFPSVVVPGPAAWAVRKPTEEPLPPEHDVQIIGYRLRLAEDPESGEPIVEGLERTWQKLLTAKQAEEGREIQSALICPQIRFLHLRYWYDGKWVESWTGGDLPQAVEITLGAQALPEGTSPGDYPYTVLRRVVYLPGSTVQGEGWQGVPSRRRSGQPKSPAAGDEEP